MSITNFLRGRRRLGTHSLSFRLFASVVALSCLAAFVAPATPAGADDVDSLSARADQIAQRLMQLQQQISELGEQFNQSQVRRAQIADHKVEIEQRSRAAQRDLRARRADASRYAVAAYVGVDQGDTLALALDGRQWDLNRRNGYASVRIGDRQQIVDDLQASEHINADLLTSLDQANRAEDQVASDLDRQQRRATALIAEAESLQASVKGQLAVAVAQRQAEIAAQAEARSSTSAIGSAPVTSVEPGAASTSQPGGPATSAPSSAPATTRPTGGGGSGSTTTPTTTPPATTPPTTAPPVVVPPPVTPPSSGGKGQIVVNAAISQLGVRYSWGGGTATGPSYGFGPGAGVKGFDCSGLALYAWAQAGVYLYHSAQMQYDAIAHVSLSQLQPGDLVFFGSSASSIDHVGIYVGGGQIIHAPNHTTVVQYGSLPLWPGYYGWTGAGRPG